MTVPVILIVDHFQLSEINKHPWVTAGGKGELELEQPMMEVVQTHVLPSIEAVDPDVLQAICSLGCFKEKEKLIQHLLSPRSVDVCPRGAFLNALAAQSRNQSTR